jgi:hypothetical protein
LAHQLSLLLLLQQRLMRQPFLAQPSPLVSSLLLLLLPLLLRELWLRCCCQCVKHIHCDIHCLFFTYQQLAANCNTNRHSSSLSSIKPSSLLLLLLLLLILLAIPCRCGLAIWPPLAALAAATIRCCCSSILSSCLQPLSRHMLNHNIL